MSGAPVKKLPARPRVSSPSVPVANRGGEKVNVGFSDFGTGDSNQLRDPRLRRSAGNDRKFSLGMSLCELFGVTFCALFGIIGLALVDPVPQPGRDMRRGETGQFGVSAFTSLRSSEPASYAGTALFR